jgi:hypothetical protein
MKNLSYIYIIKLIIFQIFLSSCCTKKECGVHLFPIIKVEYVGLQQNWIELVQIRKSDSVVLDTIRANTNYIMIAHYDGNDLRDYIYLINRPENYTDTISDIKYDIYTYYNDCNTCFWSTTGDFATNYKDLKVFINDDRYDDMPNITIEINN